MLAPAGSEAALIAAVQSGANAVYMGGTYFSARQSADNFSIDKMRDWVRYCHLRNVKVYAAVNTLIKESELDKLTEYAYALSDIGVDAVIIQDMGAIRIFRSVAADLPLHASTQMTVHSLEGVDYLSDMGFERVVLSRELSRENIEYICKNTDCEIEVFVHGALCICYSGQCLMSSIIGGRSGNRGRCAQPCRLEYELLENGKSVKKGYLLSTKDLSLIDEVNYMKEIGVKSLKIEGRLKRAEYVAAVCGIYGKYLKSGGGVTKADRAELTAAFNRSGLTKAYYGGVRGADMMSILTPGNLSENVFTDEVKKRCADNANFITFDVDIKANVVLGQTMTLEMTDCDGNSVSVRGDMPAQKAINKPLDRERLSQQLAKLGATVFKARSIDVSVDEGVSLPVSEINNIRRKAVGELEKLKLKMPERRKSEWKRNPHAPRKHTQIELAVEVMTAEQAECALKCGVKRVYAPPAVAEKLQGRTEAEIAVKAYEIVKDDMKQVKTECESVLVSMPWQKKSFEGKKLYADFRFNVFNSAAAEAYSDFECVTLSPELNLKEIAALAENTSAKLEIIAYGRLPLMITQNCPVKVAGKCRKGKAEFVLKDRKNEKFPVVCGYGCTAKILNSKPIFMADRADDLKKLKINSIRLIFTVEKSSECDKIINMYKCALNGDKVNVALADNTYTRGHYYRGAQ